MAHLGVSSSSSPDSKPRPARYNYYSPVLSSSPQFKNDCKFQPSALVAPFPTVSSLAESAPSLNIWHVEKRLAWARETLALADRKLQDAAKRQSPDALTSPDPELDRLVKLAIKQVLSIASAAFDSNDVDPPACVPEALYLCGMAYSSESTDPTQRPSSDSEMAFQYFEKAASMGWAPAWFRLGRVCEVEGDSASARECYQRGVALGEKACIYRIGMAHLFGQLSLPRSHALAVPLLQRASELADTEFPQPAYVHGMLLLGELISIDIAPSAHALLAQMDTREIQKEALRLLTRAAYLGFSPAQYKLGYIYEHGVRPEASPFSLAPSASSSSHSECHSSIPPSPPASPTSSTSPSSVTTTAATATPESPPHIRPDPLLSIQYYALASAAGSPEADMALSKWFLCGAPGILEPSDQLAFDFALRAARERIPIAQFAMGYYLEMGVGVKRDWELARVWYEKAVQSGSKDALKRLTNLLSSDEPPRSPFEFPASPTSVTTGGGHFDDHPSMTARSYPHRDGEKQAGDIAMPITPPRSPIIFAVVGKGGSGANRNANMSTWRNHGPDRAQTSNRDRGHGHGGHSQSLDSGRPEPNGGARDRRSSIRSWMKHFRRGSSAGSK
ncbi:hypothetical protein BOTBODRAFT_30116 [Botryobasidium botryosum FD-172 SS1]|uniref:HCP-like protein n=1 Tax=Botryobasidium botryosum (strain FD-172 SS1) TaxID=930990 RepID=A0A067MZL7_BOTB1|nr:hypothetical protein BOTBODRAFT_30116 [Botryobasidium botryosum FD-172 SS1]